jgi:hypothetical protein
VCAARTALQLLLTTLALVSLLLWALGKPPGQAARVATVCGLLTLLVAGSAQGC